MSQILFFVVFFTVYKQSYMVMVPDPTLFAFPFVNHLALVCIEYVYVCVYVCVYNPL